MRATPHSSSSAAVALERREQRDLAVAARRSTARSDPTAAAARSAPSRSAAPSDMASPAPSPTPSRSPDRRRSRRSTIALGFETETSYKIKQPERMRNADVDDDPVVDRRTRLPAGALLRDRHEPRRRIAVRDRTRPRQPRRHTVGSLRVAVGRARNRRQVAVWIVLLRRVPVDGEVAAARRLLALRDDVPARVLILRDAPIDRRRRRLRRVLGPPQGAVERDDVDAIIVGHAATDAGLDRRPAQRRVAAGVIGERADVGPEAQRRNRQRRLLDDEV